jgi:nicotinate-nucleotide adenylyltransferase
VTAPRRLGVLGGTFDPVHVGHLDAADAARRALTLDEIAFVPAHDPPHRAATPRAGGFHRFAMVALAIDGAPGYRVSDLELTREGPSYTADTLRTLHAVGWAPSQLFFILGTDAFAEIATWHEYPAVLDAAHFVVIARPGTTIDEGCARTPELRSRMRTPLDFEAASCATSVILVETTTRAVSSTTIRAQLADRRSIDHLVPAAVARHILAHHLYGAADGLHG